MGLLVECPECQYPNSESSKNCKGKIRSGANKGEPCTFSNLKKYSGKVYWIDYKYQGKRKRERIGSSRIAAEARLREVLKSIVEGRHISRDKNATMTLGEVFDWFLQLPEVQELDAYKRFRSQITALRRLINPGQLIRDLNVGQLEIYIRERLKEPSPSKPGQNIAPKTVKEELNLLRNVMNRALRYEVISSVPIQRYPSLKIDNVRKRVFEEQEFERLISVCPLWLRRIVLMAWGTGMRQNEIIQLEWREVDLKEGFVRLSASKTKTDEARSVRLLPEIVEMLRGIPRQIHTPRVFLSITGKPIQNWDGRCTSAWKKALKAADIQDATFHDLRHDFVTRAMRNGNASHVVMKQVGHKSDSMLRRYQLIDERDLLELHLDQPRSYSKKDFA